jgi:hypothetical protein
MKAAKAARRRLPDLYRSVIAGIWRGVRIVVWAAEAIAIKTATDETTSAAKVVADMRHLTCAKATDAISAKSAYMAAAESAAHVAAAAESAAATTAGLCARGKKAAGKHCACQNHHHSSYHDILLCAMDGLSATSRCQTLASQESKRRRRDGLEMGMPICRLH